MLSPSLENINQKSIVEEVFKAMEYDPTALYRNLKRWFKLEKARYR